MESQHTEGGGGDNVEATFIMAGDPDPVDGSASTLTGPVIGSNIPADGLFSGVNPAADSTTADASGSITATYIVGLNKFDSTTTSIKLDNAALVTTITTNGSTATVSGKIPSLLAPGSKHAAEFDYPLADGTPASFKWNFTVYNYFTFTPAMQVTPDKTKPGFIWNYSQVADIGTETQNSTQRTIDQLAGKLGPNIGDPNAQGAASGKGTPNSNANLPISFTIPAVINLAISATDPTTPANNGNFTPDQQEPGAPGTAGGTDNQAAEIITYITLPAGETHMTVNSDDGFVTYGGPIGAVTNVLGTFEGGRGATDTPYFFNVQSAGTYAFRTIWENGGGGSDIEWFTTKDDGTKVLINDTAKGGLPAYTTATGSTNVPPTISVARSAGGITVTYTGSLQSADNVTGPWADAAGASPQTFPTTGTAKFYRSKQ
jgi:hypothetical protein